MTTKQKPPKDLTRKVAMQLLKPVRPMALRAALMSSELFPEVCKRNIQITRDGEVKANPEVFAKVAQRMNSQAQGVTNSTTP